ncbi:MAG: ABC transporter permease [Actinomycetes bacterium]
MNLALLEIRRAKLRFGLLTVAVALLIFLVLFLSTISGALIESFTGALKNLNADVLVYATSARDNIQGSRLDPAVVAQVAKVPGVASAAGLATATLSAQLPNGPGDLQLFGVDPTGPGAPGGLKQGRLPSSPNEAAVDISGATIGSTITLLPTNIPLKVVGVLKGAQFAASPTAYVDLPSYQAALKAANPKAPFIPLNAVAVQTAAGADPIAVATAIGQSVTGTSGYTVTQAVAKIPGVSSVSSTFGILVGLTFVIGIVVIGFFFLILTVQKLKVFTLLRAAGASNARLAGSTVAQISIVVLISSAVAVLLVQGALQGVNTGIPVSMSPSLVIGTVIAVWLFSLLAGLLSVRRIRSIDPATAAGAR